MKKTELPKPGELWVNIHNYEYLCVTEKREEVVLFYYLTEPNKRESRFLGYFINNFKKYE